MFRISKNFKGNKMELIETYLYRNFFLKKSPRICLMKKMEYGETFV